MDLKNKNININTKFNIGFLSCTMSDENKMKNEILTQIDFACVLVFLYSIIFFFYYSEIMQWLKVDVTCYINGELL